LLIFFIDRKRFGNLQASTTIDARDEVEKTRGSTTALYTKAKELMQKTADERDELLTYVFYTTSEEMKKWALAQGRDIFDWEDTYETAQGEELILHSKIFPRHKSR